MKKSILILLFISTTQLQAQEKVSNKNIDGAYTALFGERGTETKDKVIQLVENNSEQMLAVAACEKCFPAIYTYNADLTGKLKKTVFSNSIGLYVLSYNDQGFVIVMPDSTFKQNFSYINYYGKDELEVSKMTKTKIEAYTLPLLDIL